MQLSPLSKNQTYEFGNELPNVGWYRNFGLGAGKRVWNHTTMFPQVLEAKRHHFLRFLGDEDHLATLERLNQRSGIAFSASGISHYSTQESSHQVTIRASWSGYAFQIVLECRKLMYLGPKYPRYRIEMTREANSHPISKFPYHPTSCQDWARLRSRTQVMKNWRWKWFIKVMSKSTVSKPACCSQSKHKQILFFW